MASMVSRRNDADELFSRFFGTEGLTNRVWPAGGYDVPTDVYRTDDALFIRLDLPGVDPSQVDITVQENVLMINGKREFPHDAEGVRWLRRSHYYGDFTQRVTLGRGLDTGKITADYDRGVLEVAIPYSEEVQPRKIDINVGESKALSN